MRRALACMAAAVALTGCGTAAHTHPRAAAGADPLMVGNETTTFTHEQGTTAKQINAIQSTALHTGTVETLEYRSNGVANTGVTSVVEGLYEDTGANLPKAEPLCEGTFSGAPAINTWIKVTGLSCKVTSGQKYWLALTPQGAEAHWNFSTEAGTGEPLALAEGIEHTTLKAVTWSAEKVFKSGPIGFAAQGSEEFPTVPSGPRKLVMMP